MERTKDFLTETRDTVSEWSKSPNINPVEKLQYRMMEKNLNGMLNIILWIQNMRQCKKAR